jgi:hypothetical protein
LTLSPNLNVRKRPRIRNSHAEQDAGVEFLCRSGSETLPKDKFMKYLLHIPCQKLLHCLVETFIFYLYITISKSTQIFIHIQKIRNVMTLNHLYLCTGYVFVKNKPRYRTKKKTKRN